MTGVDSMKTVIATHDELPQSAGRRRLEEARVEGDLLSIYRSRYKQNRPAARSTNVPLTVNRRHLPSSLSAGKLPFRCRSVPFRSVPFRSVPFRSVPFRSDAPVCAFRSTHRHQKKRV